MGGPPLRGEPGTEVCAPTLFSLGVLTGRESKTTLNLQGVSGPTPRIFSLADQHPLGVKEASQGAFQVGLGDPGLFGLRLFRNNLGAYSPFFKWLTARPAAV